MATSNYFRIEAPYPAIASTVLLPRPRLGNNLGSSSSVRVVTMMDGSRRSFIKRGNGKKTHRWDFLIADGKMEEFMDFIERYRAATMRITWRDRTIIGKVNANPVEVIGAGGEAHRVTVELVEV